MRLVSFLWFYHIALLFISVAARREKPQQEAEEAVDIAAIGADSPSSAGIATSAGHVLLTKPLNDQEIEQCLEVENGKTELYAYADQRVIFINKINELACICRTVKGALNIAKEEFLGIQGALRHEDCGALRYFAREFSSNWLRLKENGVHNETTFRYVETGSYLGASSHIIVHSLREVLPASVQIIAYAHDLFDVSTTDLWDQTTDKHMTYLQQFYRNVQRNQLEGTIIPIAGHSPATLGIHQPNSIDMVFIDGDHTYEGALNDFREAWKILRPGAYMMGHDAVPEEEAVYHEGMGWNGVRKALRQFCKEMGLRWNPPQPGLTTDAFLLVPSTAHIFILYKATATT